MFCSPAFDDMYEALSYGELIDERDVYEDGVPCGLDGTPPEQWWAQASASGLLLDQTLDDVDQVTLSARVHTARQYALFAQILRGADENPDPWCGPDPTLAPDWVDTRERSAATVRAQRRDHAVRAAVLDLALRVHMTETTVRSRAYDAQTLQQRCPQVWNAFGLGLVDERNAVTAAGLAASLPDDDATSWAAFDEQVHDGAQRLPPGKFRTHARARRERVHAESLDARHRRAKKDRAVWTSPELDGMATLTVYGPAAEITAAESHIDQRARHLRGQQDETRTLAQIRADVALGVLGREDAFDDDWSPTKPAVAVTIPVLSLLGHSDEPATLDGYGPIDLDTAKRLAGQASSWIRILTHPVTGTVLDVDRKTYRVPKALKRWLGVRDPVCTTPGCGRLARDCDIDHRIEWQDGGTTSARNTGPLCKPHHVVKTHTRWRVSTHPDTGKAVWTSPFGRVIDADPPPW